MQIQDVFTQPQQGERHKAQVLKRKFSVEEGDHLTMLNVFTAFIANGRSSRWCAENCLNFRGLTRALNVRNQVEISPRSSSPGVPLFAVDSLAAALRRAIDLLSRHDRRDGQDPAMSRQRLLPECREISLHWRVLHRQGGLPAQGV